MPSSIQKGHFYDAENFLDVELKKIDLFFAPEKAFSMKLFEPSSLVAYLLGYKGPVV